MSWRQPSRRLGQLWLGKFNEAFAELTASGFTDGGAASRALSALRGLLEREPECAGLVSGLLTVIVFQGLDALLPERAVEAIDLASQAERRDAGADEEDPLRRAYLGASRARIRLNENRPFQAVDDAAAAGRLIRRQEGQEEGEDDELTAYVLALATVTEAEGWDALLEPAAAVDRYRAAFDLAGSFVLEREPLARLLAELVSFLYHDSEQVTDEVARATLQVIWHSVASIRVSSAVGIARCQAILRAPDAGEAAREAAAAIRSLGPGPVGAFRLVPVVRCLDGDTMRSFLADVADQARATGLDAYPYQALLYAVGAVAIASEGGDPAETLKEARAARRRVKDDLVAAASLGWAMVAETASGIPAERRRRRVRAFLGAVERLAETPDDRLRDLSVRAAFDEPLAALISEIAVRYAARRDTDTRIHFARLLDNLWDARPPLPALLRESDGLGGIEGAAPVLDYVGRLEAALRTWPDAVAVIQRQLGRETLFVCVSAGSPTIVTRAGPAWLEAARSLASQLQAEIAAIELVGAPGPASGFQAAGQACFEALPGDVRELLAAHSVILVCPDYRTSGDSIPYELFHDGSAWLGLAKILARFPSLRALTRSAEGTARRNPDLRALAVAVPHADGFDDLHFAAEEAEWVRQYLTAGGWDAPEIAPGRVSPAFLLDRLQFTAHLHVAAHGDASGHDEAIVVEGGERLRTDDLLRRFFPRMPAVYLNTCDLAATRYVGAGVSRGVALALAERGAAAVVANLLPVDDSASSQLAGAFYQAMEQDSAPFGEALRRARSTVAAGGASPLFWGTTVLIGDPRTTLLPSPPAATLAQRLLDAYFAREGEVDEAAVGSAEQALADGPYDPRLSAAAALLRACASWPGTPEAAGRRRLSSGLHLALALDHLPAAATLARLVLETIDDETEHDLALEAVEESLVLAEPLEPDGDQWQRLLLALRARWEKLRQGDRQVELRVTGGGDEDARAETRAIGQTITDINLALSAKARRGGYGPEPREERTTADVCWNAIISGQELDHDDMPAVFAMAQQIVQRLVRVAGLGQPSVPFAGKPVAGLLLWLWGRQHATDLPADMAEGQSGTLGQLVESLRQHWPPAPAPWFERVQGFPEELSAGLTSLEGLDYWTELYPRMDEVFRDIAARAEELLATIRDEEPERVPDAAAWILGSVIERNTYSWTDGSVPQDISERLQNVFHQVSSAFKGDEIFWPWLVEGFRQVREREPDELERWRFGMGRIDDEAEVDDEAGNGLTDEGEPAPEAPHGGSPAQPPARRLPRPERQARIRELLDEPGEDTSDELPAGLIDLIVDESDLTLLEDGLDPALPPVVHYNAAKAIGYLASSEYRDRVIASPDTSVPKLRSLYEATSIRRIRRTIVQSMFLFAATDIPFEFLIDRLAVDHVEVKAEILSGMQFVANRPYLKDLITQRLLPMLHEFCEQPLRTSVYEDEMFGEMDFRFWVFRCLRVIGSSESVPVIERYMEANDWPLETLAEGAHAHWALTHTPVYLEVLREAKRRHQIGNTEGALKEMEKFVRSQARKQKAGEVRDG